MRIERSGESTFPLPQVHEEAEYSQKRQNEFGVYKMRGSVLRFVSNETDDSDPILDGQVLHLISETKQTGLFTPYRNFRKHILWYFSTSHYGSKSNSEVEAGAFSARPQKQPVFLLHRRQEKGLHLRLRLRGRSSVEGRCSAASASAGAPVQLGSIWRRRRRRLFWCDGRWERWIELGCHGSREWDVGQEQRGWLSVSDRTGALSTPTNCFLPWWIRIWYNTLLLSVFLCFIFIFLTRKFTWEPTKLVQNSTVLQTQRIGIINQVSFLKKKMFYWAVI